MATGENDLDRLLRSVPENRWGMVGYPASVIAAVTLMNVSVPPVDGPMWASHLFVIGFDVAPSGFVSSAQAAMEGGAEGCPPSTVGRSRGGPSSQRRGQEWSWATAVGRDDVV